MANSAQSGTERNRRVLFTMGGKGGTGKTSFVCVLAEWCLEKEVPFRLLDLDTENRVRGSLSHYFPRLARKVEMHTRGGLDEFFDFPENAAPLILADLGAAAGNVTFSWFDRRWKTAQNQGVRFTAVGLITPDPTTVESVLSWANSLQDRVEYWIVKNAISLEADFSFWEQAKPARMFREAFRPRVLEMEFRVPTLEHAARQHGITLSTIAGREIHIAELQKSAMVMRAQAYRRHLFHQLDSLPQEWTVS